jgi:Flp pilus assembly protein TadG
MNYTRHHRQRGAIVLTLCFLMFFLLGFIGISLDFGRLFVVKSELQTAMDSCALSAAQELDGMADSITRARGAGAAAGNLNRVNLQSANWSGQGQVADSDFTFRTADYAVTTDPVLARYVECRHVQPSVRMWLLHAMNAFSGPSAANTSTRSVVASAVATRGSSQTTCPIPVALRPKTDPATCAGGNCSAPNYGFAVGEWVTLLMGQNVAAGGEIGWVNLDGSNSASETEREMLGSCGTRIGQNLGTPGVQASIADAWNIRFGIYKNNADPAVYRPDMTGYAYTDQNWPPLNPGNPYEVRNAYNGTPNSDPTGTAQNFLTKRQNFASCANQNPATGNQGVTACEAITGQTYNSFQKVAAPGPTANGGHREYGISRRIVLVPVIGGGTTTVIDYACMLLLQPLSVPMANVQLEFRGNAAAIGSPCTTAGIPGGVAGPLVPVLVR